MTDANSNTHSVTWSQQHSPQRYMKSKFTKLHYIYKKKELYQVKKERNERNSRTHQISLAKRMNQEMSSKMAQKRRKA